jgi:hypothetical protein
MAKILADNLQLFVKDAAGSGFSKPDGQGNLTINRTDTDIDLSDKNTGQYGASAPGQQTLTVTQAFQPNLPDAAYSRMKTVSKDRATTTYQIRDITIADPEDAVMFECVMYTSFGNSDAPQKGVLGTSATMRAAAAPTVDLI